MTRGPALLHWTLLSAACLLGASGCTLLLPEVSHQPLLHNPFPQLSRVAVAPFFNQSDEPTVDGRQFAMAYYAELQGVPGFEVVPLGVVEEAILQHAIDLSSPGEARRLAEVLGVDAVLIGSVTDYTPYYPPRCGLRVEWYAANPGFHEIPAGYGLPWGTPDEEYIPEELVFEAEMALAREQLKTQTPDCGAGCESLVAPPGFDEPHHAQPIPTTDPTYRDARGVQRGPATEWLPPPPDADGVDPGEADPSHGGGGGGGARGDGDKSAWNARPGVVLAQHATAHRTHFVDSNATGPTTAPCGPFDTTGATQLPLVGWPDARGFTPAGPSPTRPPCVPTLGPVMTHTRVYRGHDPDFTSALASYVSFRDDARFGGWQSYLERSDDFIRFCAHLHLAETLTARGGGGETRVVSRWPDSR
ncbi:MAG: hypothetical protein AAGB00_00210 [Planctomycetota bacterium]